MKIMSDSIEAQRRLAGPLVVGLACLMVPVVGVEGLTLSHDTMILVAGSAVFATIATSAWKIMGETTIGRSLPGISLMGQISLLVANASNLQSDWHLAYFAALAVLIIYGDWVVILAAAATVAVHDLVLTLIMPNAVFSDATALGRLVLHAAILTVEAGTLIWVTANLTNMFKVSGATLRAAEEAAKHAQLATVEAAGARQAETMARTRASDADGEARAEERKLVVDSVGRAIMFLMQGDLTNRINEDLPGEYGAIRSHFNEAVAKLQETLKLIASSSTAVSSEADGILSHAHDLSRRTEQQEDALKETAAAVDTITATALKISKEAGQALQVVGATKSEAEQSDDIVRRTVEAVSQIEQSSGQIGQIIGVIDQIAFQTNLLALNAGVEAARAGDAGRGFAVVASEVRSLAQRSSEAAKEIRALIVASSAQVERGVALVGQTGHALEGIISKVDDLTTRVSEIATSASLQTTSLAQVNAALDQLDRITRQNVEMAERSTSASGSLVEKTRDLGSLIGSFNVGGSAVQTAQTRRAA